MRVHLVNPSHAAFGVAVITPRWLFVLAGATPRTYGDPVLVDESLEQFDPATVQPGDVVGISIHTGNALRGYDVGKAARARGAWVVYGGIHATLFPEEPHSVGDAHAVVTGDGDVIWPLVLADCAKHAPKRMYNAGRVPGEQMVKARWDLIQRGKYMWASVQTVRGCPKHCSFCSVWRTDGQAPRVRGNEAVVEEVVELRRLGFRFIALADDNFYPVTHTDLAQAGRRQDRTRFLELEAMRNDRLDLMRRLSGLPSDMVFFTQITMEASEDHEFLDAMREARIKGALVGVESITPDGLKEVYKGFNATGRRAGGAPAHLQGARHPRARLVHLRASERPARDVRRDRGAGASKADITFAQFVMLTPFPGTVDFEKWAKGVEAEGKNVDGIPYHAPLAHSAEQAAADVHPPPGHVGRRDPDAHAAHVGPVLQHRDRCGAAPGA